MTGTTLTLAEVRERPTLTVAETSAVLNLGRSATYAAIRAGEIPSLRIGGRVVVPTSRLLALLDGDDN